MSEPWNTFPTCWNCETPLTDWDIDQSPTECIYCGAEFEISTPPMSEVMKTYLGVNFDTAWYGDTERSSVQRSAYLRGLAAGFCAFAWWKDGIQYVGSCGTKLVDAMAVIRQELDRLTSRVSAPVVEFPKGEDDVSDED